MAQTNVHISIHWPSSTVEPSEVPIRDGDSVAFVADDSGATLLCSEEAAAVLYPTPEFQTDIAPNETVVFSFRNAEPGTYVLDVFPPDCDLPATVEGSSCGGSSAMLAIHARSAETDPNPIIEGTQES
jgi:hypothetical protein